MNTYWYQKSLLLSISIVNKPYSIKIITYFNAKNALLFVYQHFQKLHIEMSHPVVLYFIQTHKMRIQCTLEVSIHQL